MLTLTPTTKILKLIEAHPFLLDFLASYNPEFLKLKNPVLRNTMGRVATLQMASIMANIPLAKFMDDIAAEIARQTGNAPDVGQGDLEQDPQKVETLKSIIQDLHDGANVGHVKQRFAKLVEDVSPREIADMEQQLISEGLPQDEVKRLCDVHVQVFKDSLDKLQRPEAQPGHPVHTFMAENRELQHVIAALRTTPPITVGAHCNAPLPDPPQWEILAREFTRLAEVEKHYIRKEHQLFPYLEQKGFTGPSQVMWAIHDDVRALLKSVRAAITSQDAKVVKEDGRRVLTIIEEMIYKEEHILLPVSLELLDTEEWVGIKEGSTEIGYALYEPADLWRPVVEGEEKRQLNPGALLSRLPLDTGLMSLEQLNLMLTHLPIELSFVDENEEVRYFTQKPDKIFPRTPGVIGRKVQNCHPPKSLHIVNRILDEFRSESKDSAEFWIEMNDRFIHIRYFAVRDPKGTYKGTVETVQDVTGIRSLEGQRRLLDWD